MAMFKLKVNGKAHSVDVDPNTPLLWVLRENVGLTGTKYGCGVAQCGACTVHVDGKAVLGMGTAGAETGLTVGRIERGDLMPLGQEQLQNAEPDTLSRPGQNDFHGGIVSLATLR